VDPESIPWSRTGDSPEKTKYPYIIHAETNAILNAKSQTEECILYSTLFPCNVCAGNIIQAGISEVIYMSDKYHYQWFTKLARELLSKAGVKFYQYVPKYWSEQIPLIVNDV